MRWLTIALSRSQSFKHPTSPLDTEHLTKRWTGVLSHKSIVNEVLFCILLQAITRVESVVNRFSMCHDCIIAVFRAGAYGVRKVPIIMPCCLLMANVVPGGFWKSPAMETMVKLAGSYAPRGYLPPATASMSPCDNTALLIHTTISASQYVCVCMCA